MPKGDNKDKWQSKLGEVPVDAPRKSMAAKVEGIARICFEANRVYCKELLNDNSHAASWDEAPEYQRESTITGVRRMLVDPLTTTEQMHESWLEVKQAAGWVYGAHKSETHKTHPCCLPYNKLPPADKFKDHLFRAIVNAAKEL